MHDSRSLLGPHLRVRAFWAERAHGVHDAVERIARHFVVHPEYQVPAEAFDVQTIEAFTFTVHEPEGVDVILSEQREARGRHFAESCVKRGSVQLNSAALLPQPGLEGPWRG